MRLASPRATNTEDLTDCVVLATKDSEWLDVVERLLREYETAIPKRENQQPQ